jgi:hypothetical protein
VRNDDHLCCIDAASFGQDTLGLIAVDNHDVDECCQTSVQECSERAERVDVSDDFVIG